MSSKIISAGDLQGQELQTLQFASFGQGTPNSRLARTTAAVAPRITLPSSMDLGALLAAAGVNDPAGSVTPAFASEPVLPASMRVDADEASALLAPGPELDDEGSASVAEDGSDALPEPEPEIPEEPAPQWPTAAELEAIHQEAYQAGYDAGHAEGLARGAESGHQQAFDQAQQQFDQQVQVFARLQDAFQANLAELEAEVAPALLKLAVNAVEKLLHDQLAAKPDAVLAVIKQALQVIPSELARATVRAHPADIAALRTFLPTQTPDTLWQFVEDASITQGGCLVDMPSASLDLTLQTRWTALLATLGAEADVGA